MRTHTTLPCTYILHQCLQLCIVYHTTALFLTFEQNLYEVREGDGMVNNLVFVVKQDGRESEQVLPVLAQLQIGSAIRGQTKAKHDMHGVIQYWPQALY